MVIYNILRSFEYFNGLCMGTFCGRFVYFSQFCFLYQEKSGNPAVQQSSCDVSPNVCCGNADVNFSLMACLHEQ
jgi:hypothetical protein